MPFWTMAGRHMHDGQNEFELVSAKLGYSHCEPVLNELEQGLKNIESC